MDWYRRVRVEQPPRGALQESNVWVGVAVGFGVDVDIRVGADGCVDVDVAAGAELPPSSLKKCIIYSWTYKI